MERNGCGHSVPRVASKIEDENEYEQEYEQENVCSQARSGAECRRCLSARPENDATPLRCVADYERGIEAQYKE